MSAIPTIYFIDDSATMREVIKIAFRRENINVVACHDAALALVEIEKTRPDIVITDVIMPDKDGYDVCQYIKSHPELKKTPVVLMSGVVNRAVAERAFAVRADELLRKPFQPQDLIARVKHLLKPNGTPKPTPAAAANAAAALSSIFSAAAPARPAAAAPPSQRSVALITEAPASEAAPAPARPSAPVPASVPGTVPPPAIAKPSPAPVAVPAFAPVPPASPAPAPSAMVEALAPAAGPVAPSVAAPAVAAATAKPVNGNEAARLKIEILRLEGLIRKLQSELQAEREYTRSLESHVKSLQETR
ncbi:MAG TPA: response regulator [Candidatus Angelobacter sp.]